MKTFSISNNKIEVAISTLGARIVSIYLKAHDLHVVNGFQTEQEYTNLSNSSGAVCGRYSGRIGGARFTVDGRTYKVTDNNNGNCLHGGPIGLRAVQWQVDKHSSDMLSLLYFSKDGEEGFPGNVHFKVIYHIHAGALHIQLLAKTDRITPVNLTSHPYFNLKGEGNGSVLDHEVVLNAMEMLELDDNCIPTGKTLQVAQTPFDFTSSKTIGDGLKQKHSQLLITEGFDHTFVLQGREKEVSLNAMVFEPTSGRTLKVYSDYPGIQFFVPNKAIGDKYAAHSSFCLEPQYFPDSPNKPQFPGTWLKPDQPYRHTIVYDFG